MKILWLANIPSPYRVDFFNELGKYCDLTVLFERRTSSERDKSWARFEVKNFHAVFLNGIKRGVDNAICPNVVTYLKRGKYDHIIVTNYSDFTGAIAIVYMKINRMQYWLEGDGAFAGSGRGFKETIKRILITGAKGYFSTGKEHDKYYLNYGATREKIYRYPFTSVKEDDILSFQLFSQNDKSLMREKLSLKEKKIILSVGRFSYRGGYGKGFDKIMRIAGQMGPEYGFVIVGDNPTEEFVEWRKKEKLNNVYFVGFKNKNELANYYVAADVFVLLSIGEAWGLVINEAMAFGLPVIASNKCVSANELIEEGENGYVVNADDIEVIKNRINHIFEDDNRRVFGLNSLRKINSYTIENMAKIHISYLCQSYFGV